MSSEDALVTGPELIGSVVVVRLAGELDRRRLEGIAGADGVQE